MSKELKMLREMVADEKRIYLDRLALKIILHRFEAAERVCEKIEVLVAEPDDAEGWRQVHKALGAYRDLDAPTKETP